MKYLDPKFSSRPATDAYRDGWERTFGSTSDARRKLWEMVSRRADAVLGTAPPLRSWRNSPLNEIGKPKRPRRRG